ncbi:MAG TPA: PfkB family carbohydrate kinase [Solirubrobacteraceae bacterium]|nr:PfkB family carbohydrate kinase [Solirubrobacteraceae bacterium]
MTPKVGVVGHVEAVEFLVVDRHPRPGEVVHAREWFTQAGGGGAVAAVQLANLAGRATFLTALATDVVGDALRTELEDHRVTLHAAARAGRHRRGITHLDAATGERTITILGERIVPRGDDPLPWPALRTFDALYFTAGDAAAARAARAARILVATARAVDALAESGVELDALVASGADRAEDVDASRLLRPPRITVRTEGAGGGTWTAADGTTGRWDATAPPGPVVDAYGCGDAFAAGLTFGLGAGLDLPAALRLGARCGAHCLAGRGPYAGQLELVRR